jgi:cytochrome c-type biogenesis protein
MDHIFARLSVALEGSALIALFAALAWGVLSVILSPCHLATIPLIVAFVGGGSVGQPRRRAVVLSGAFASGMFVALALVGVVFAVAGHALQRYRAYGSYATALILLAAGLSLLGLLPGSFQGLKPWAPERKGALAALAAGLFVGIGLSPCTLAYVAPVLGVTLGAGATHAVFGWVLLLAFAVGHCAVVAVAGVSTGMVQRFLDWNERSRGALVLKKVCGGLLLVGAATLFYTA